jgi:hypothetical protein
MRFYRVRQESLSRIALSFSGFLHGTFENVLFSSYADV